MSTDVSAIEVMDFPSYLQIVALKMEVGNCIQASTKLDFQNQCHWFNHPFVHNAVLSAHQKQPLSIIFKLFYL